MDNSIDCLILSGLIERSDCLSMLDEFTLTAQVDQNMREMECTGI